MAPFWNIAVMQGLDDWSKKSLGIAARPWYAKDLDAAKVQALQKQALERRTKAIEDIKSRQAGEREARVQADEAIKGIRAKQAEEKRLQEELRTEEKRIAKQKADIAKEEKRVQGLEDRALKQQKAKEDAVEKAKRKAEKQAIQAEQRQQKAIERDEKLRRMAAERADRARHQQELELLKRKAYNDKQEELALEAEVRRKAYEARQEEIRLEAEERYRQEQVEKEAYEKQLRDLRINAFKTALASLPDPPIKTQAMQAQADTSWDERLQKLRADTLKAAGTSAMPPPRTSAAHPGPPPRTFEAEADINENLPAAYGPLLARFGSVTPHAASSTGTSDHQLGTAINARMKELIGESIGRLAADKAASTAKIENWKKEASVPKTSPKRYADAGPANLTAIPPSVQATVQQQATPAAGAAVSPVRFFEAEDAEDGRRNDALRDAQRVRRSATMKERSRQTPVRRRTVPKPDALESTQTVIQYLLPPAHGSNLNSVDPFEDGNLVYVTVAGAFKGRIISQVERRCTASYVRAPLDPRGLSRQQEYNARAQAVKALARKVQPHGFNGLVKIVTYEARSTETGDLEFLASGEPVVTRGEGKGNRLARKASGYTDNTDPLGGLFGTSELVDEEFYH